MIRINILEASTLRQYTRSVRNMGITIDSSIRSIGAVLLLKIYHKLSLMVVIVILNTGLEKVYLLNEWILVSI